ncbi:MAG: hypothetical protein ABII89_00500 [Candidatus Omnitrophota bacterium]
MKNPVLRELVSPHYQKMVPHTTTHNHADFLPAEDVVFFRTDSFFRSLI